MFKLHFIVNKEKHPEKLIHPNHALTPIVISAHTRVPEALKEPENRS
jgi:hypothetical protein